MKRIWFLYGVALPLVWPLLTVADEFRTWTAVTGQYRVEARFVKLAGEDVTIQRKDNGQAIVIPMSKLCAVDVSYIRSRAGAKARVRPDAGKKAGPGAKDDSVAVPKDLDGDAKRAFDQGFKYFIWASETGPFQARNGEVEVPFNYVAKAKTPPYQAYQAAFVVAVDGGEIVSTMKVPRKQLRYGPSGSSFVVFRDHLRSLSGRGTARIHLLDYETGRKQLSNEFVVPVEFK